MSKLSAYVKFEEMSSPKQENVPFMIIGDSEQDILLKSEKYGKNPKIVSKLFDIYFKYDLFYFYYDETRKRILKKYIKCISDAPENCGTIYSEKELIENPISYETYEAIKKNFMKSFGMFEQNSFNEVYLNTSGNLFFDSMHRFVMFKITNLNLNFFWYPSYTSYFDKNFEIIVEIPCIVAVAVQYK